MNSYLSRLNPAERRFVVVVGLVFFLVINIFFVWPHFSDWGNLRGRLSASHDKLARYQTTIQQKSKVEGEMKKLASEGSYVPAEDQSIQFLRTIQVQAAQSGVGIQSSSRSFTSTNQFFIEQAQTIGILSGEKQLVDFLYNLGSGNSLVRARDISVRPDASRQQINAQITLVASYQKSARAPAPAAKPAAPPVTKPAAPVTSKPAVTPPANKPLTRPGTPPTTSPSKPVAPKPATPNKQ
ncbi:MAG: hypothetical protein H7Y43_12740 [Akkermansiaceae bacterium]|nr:hypothetical protein [Verrucomicrobiales bacterium]